VGRVAFTVALAHFDQVSRCAG